MTVKIELERVKKYGTTVLRGIGSNKIKPSTYDGQITVETYRLQFKVASRVSKSLEC